MNIDMKSYSTLLISAISARYCTTKSYQMHVKDIDLNIFGDNFLILINMTIVFIFYCHVGETTCLLCWWKISTLLIRPIFKLQNLPPVKHLIKLRIVLERRQLIWDFTVCLWQIVVFALTVSTRKPVLGYPYYSFKQFRPRSEGSNESSLVRVWKFW